MCFDDESHSHCFSCDYEWNEGYAPWEYILPDGSRVFGCCTYIPPEGSRFA